MPEKPPADSDGKIIGDVPWKFSRMTSEEFEAGYAARSGITVTELHDLGLYPQPCDCGEDGCQGWAMDWEQRHAILEAARRHAGLPREPPDPGPGTQ